MTLKRLDGLTCVTVPLLIILLSLFFISHKKSILTTEKTTFGSASTSSKSQTRIIFYDVYLKKTFGGNIKRDVYVCLEKDEWFNVVIDKKLKGTKISIIPTLDSRLGVVTYAKQVTIWVSTPEEKELWGKWAQKSEEECLKTEKKENEKPPLKKIMPKLY
jgi:hypothetical protein